MIQKKYAQAQSLLEEGRRLGDPQAATQPRTPFMEKEKHA